MASLLMVPVLRAAVVQAPSIQDTLSGVFGSVSLAAWICLLVRLRLFPKGSLDEVVSVSVAIAFAD